MLMVPYWWMTMTHTNSFDYGWKAGFIHDWMDFLKLISAFTCPNNQSSGLPVDHALGIFHSCSDPGCSKSDHGAEEEQEDLIEPDTVFLGKFPQKIRS